MIGATFFYLQPVEVRLTKMHRPNVSKVLRPAALHVRQKSVKIMPIPFHLKLIHIHQNVV